MKTALAAALLTLSMPLASAQENPSNLQAEKIVPANEPSGGLLDIGTPDRVVELVQDAGYRAKLIRMDDGHTFIESSANGTKFQIHFHGCNEDKTDCELLVFTAGFDFADAQDESIAAEWNYNRFTKAYLDKEGDPFIQLPVNILHGITPANFEDTLVWFTNEMGAFMDHIGWYPQDTEDPATRIGGTPT